MSDNCESELVEVEESSEEEVEIMEREIEDEKENHTNSDLIIDKEGVDESEGLIKPKEEHKKGLMVLAILIMILYLLFTLLTIQEILQILASVLIYTYIPKTQLKDNNLEFYENFQE